MNYVISVINKNGLSILSNICERLEIPIVLSLYGKGTASKKMRDVLGIESNEKSIVITLSNEEKTNKLITQQKQRLYIDAPGNGIVVSIPVKSVGGINILSYIEGDTKKMKTPKFNFEYELIIVIANEGSTDTVMDIARSAGAGGGTVIHAKGTGKESSEKFFNVSIATEKEMIMIVSKKEKKADIMRAIVEKAGASTPCGAITFSLPVSDVEGFRKEENPDENQ